MKRKKKLEVAIEDATKKRLHILLGDIAKQYVALKQTCGGNVKVLINIYSPISTPLLMSEMSAINKMVNMVIPLGMDCEVKWGLFPWKTTYAS